LELWGASPTTLTPHVPLAVVSVVRLELRGAPRRCWCCALELRGASPTTLTPHVALAVVGVVRWNLCGASPTTFTTTH
jgi:hypothetical protein